MSLGIIIKAPEGIVLAAESRVTLTAMPENGGTPVNVNYDNATKLLNFNRPNLYVGVVTYGQAAIGIRTAHSFIPEFETSLDPTQRLTVLDFAKKLSAFFLLQWTKANMPDSNNYQGQEMIFHVAGYDDGQAYGKTYKFSIPKNPMPIEENPGDESFGFSWGGQREIVDRITMGYDMKLIKILTDNNIIQTQDESHIISLLRQLQLNIPIQFMPLQDCVNLAILLLRTTIKTLELTVGLRGCGGAIDVAIITRNKPITFIQRKEVIGEI